MNKQPSSASFRIRQIWALCLKNIQLYFRKGPVIMFGFLFPLFMTLAWVIGRDISSPRLFVGVTSMSAFFVSTAISPVILPWETRERGLERQITAPLNVTTILWGIILASTLFAIVITGIVSFSLGMFLGIVFNGFWALLGFIIGLILITLTGSFIGVLFSAPPTDQLPDIMTLANVIKFPLVFISGIFISLNQMSPATRFIAWLSPLTPFVEISNELTGEIVHLPFVYNIIILVIWAFVMYAITFYAHSKTFYRRFA